MDPNCFNQPYGPFDFGATHCDPSLSQRPMLLLTLQEPPWHHAPRNADANLGYQLNATQRYHGPVNPLMHCQGHGNLQPQIQWTRASLGANIAAPTDRRARKTKRRTSLAKRKRARPSASRRLIDHRPFADVSSTGIDFSHVTHDLPNQRPPAPAPWSHSAMSAIAVSKFDPNSFEPFVEEATDVGAPSNRPNSWAENVPMEWFELDPYLEVEVPIDQGEMDAEVEELKKIMALMED